MRRILLIVSVIVIVSRMVFRVVVNAAPNESHQVIADALNLIDIPALVYLWAWILQDLRKAIR